MNPAKPTSATASRPQSQAEVEAWFRKQNKFVVTFMGYSGAGYEDPERMQADAEAQLRRFDPARTIINCGATAEGIGAIYPIANRLGFETTGIVSSKVLSSDSPVSAHVDHVFYVADKTWGGFLADSEELSPTSQAMVNVSDEFIAIGGGEVARDELVAAQRVGKPVRFIPADMNHQKAIEKARAKSQAPPTTFSGDVAPLFGATAR